MVDLFAGVDGFKAMLDMGKSLVSMSKTVARNEAVIGLQQVLNATGLVFSLA